jgi:hypothetical protein
METAPESIEEYEKVNPHIEIAEESNPAQPNSNSVEEAKLSLETTSLEIKESSYDRILNIINSFGEVPGHEESKYDRMVDVIATKGNSASHINSNLLKSHIPRSEGTARSPIFEKVPSHIRLQIWGNLFSIPPGKKINLSKDFVTKYVFPVDYFISPWDVIEPIEGAISSCHQMRQEILWYFCHEFHFHVTFSPFTTGPTLSGLSIRWLNPYAKWIKNLTLEVDLTRLAFSKANNATYLSLGKPCIMVYDLIDNLVKALVERSKVEGDVSAGQGQHGKVHIENLHLMVRRYKGVREAPENLEDGTASLSGSSTTNSVTSCDSTPSTVSTLFSEFLVKISFI